MTITAIKSDDPRNATYIPKLRDIVEDLLDFSKDDAYIQRIIPILQGMHHSFAIGMRISNAYINEHGVSGNLNFGRQDIDAYAKRIVFNGCSDDIVDAHMIVQDAFLKNSRRVNGGNRDIGAQARKQIERQWLPSGKPQHLFSMFARMKEHGFFEHFKAFVQSDDCVLPKRKIIKTIDFWERQQERAFRRELKDRRFTVIDTDGMQPPALKDKDQGAQRGTNTSGHPRLGQGQKPVIDSMRITRVEELLRKDPSLKSEPMLKFTTEALPAAPRGTAIADMDIRQTHQYRNREATYTWFHVERKDGQWVQIGVSSVAEHPTYVAMHNPAIDIDDQTVSGSVKTLRADPYVQILKDTDTFKSRLKAAIHIDKDEIEPCIHELFDWVGTPEAGAALLASAIACIEETGEDPKTNQGIIRFGDKTVQATGKFNSLNGRTEWHAARAALSRGSVSNFECVQNLREMSDIARHHMASAKGQKIIPVLRETARKNVYAANAALHAKVA